MSAQTAFAANVKRFRQARGLTQTELAEAISMTLQTVFSYEAGAKFPRADTIDDLAKALGVRPWQLFAAEGEGGAIPPELIEHLEAAARAAGILPPKG